MLLQFIKEILCFVIGFYITSIVIDITDIFPMRRKFCVDGTKYHLGKQIRGMRSYKQTMSLTIFHPRRTTIYSIKPF